MTDTDKPTVLVIEDDEIARGSLVRALQDVGYSTIEAENGQTGYDTALAQHPNLILSDNLMPAMKGTELLENLRRDSWGKDVPFILLTSQYDLGAVNNSLQAGNTDFMVKDDTSLSQIVETVSIRLSK